MGRSWLRAQWFKRIEPSSPSPDEVTGDAMDPPDRKRDSRLI
jgi:hypothetical protein